jgi:hypothetical protein
MKHKLTVLICVIAIVIVGILSVQAYNHYQANQKIHNQTVATQNAKLAQQKANANQSEVDQLKTVCNQEVAGFNQLSLVQRAKISLPNCEKISIEL